MISTHLTVDLSCCASVSNHGVAWSVQVSVKKSKRMPALRASSCAHMFFSVHPTFFTGASLRVAGAMNGASQYSKEQLEQTKGKPTNNVSTPCFQRPDFTIRGQRSRPIVWANCMATVKRL